MTAPDAVDSFSANYAQARAKFRAAAQAASADVLDSLEYPVRGPDGAPLHTDIAWFGPRSAERVAVLISGTHGVEGFCGSGAQIDLLRRGELTTLPDGAAVLMIHAINPYGFAWLRRVTHENVDLNRNWVDFTKPLPANPGYAQLQPAICPQDWTDATANAGAKAMADYAETHGADALRNAMGSGQYGHPQGLYYGGAAPTWSRRTQSDIFTAWLGEAQSVAILDYHTGLGPWGYVEPISTAPRDSAAFERARGWYGAALTSTVDGSSTGARIAGDGLNGAAAVLPGRTVTAVALEVGTLERPFIQRALRADAWLHAHGDPLSPQGDDIRRDLRTSYYGDRADWKAMVAGQTLATWRQLLAGLAAG